MHTLLVARASCDADIADIVDIADIADVTRHATPRSVRDLFGSPDGSTQGREGVPARGWRWSVRVRSSLVDDRLRCLCRLVKKKKHLKKTTKKKPHQQNNSQNPCHLRKHVLTDADAASTPLHVSFLLPLSFLFCGVLLFFEGDLTGRICESTTHLHEFFEDPVDFKAMPDNTIRYIAPKAPGFAKMVDTSVGEWVRALFV